MNITILDDLPPLAWLADLDPAAPLAVCGRDVEVFEDGLFEGVWAGDFGARDFAGARHVFGSGIVRRGEGWEVVTASHTLEAAYVLRGTPGASPRCVVANSLAFLTRWTGIELPYDPAVADRLITVRDGTDCYERLLFQGEGWTIHRACFDNLRLDTDGMTWVPKAPFTGHFGDYASYRDTVLEVLGAIVANGQDSRRKARYEITSTCSSGYDSTACAALAAELGATRGFTIKAARGGGDDSGRPLLERMGLAAVEVDRALRPDGKSFDEAEFIATGMGGDEFAMAPFGPHLRHTILLSGYGGERLWGCDGPVSRNAHQDDEPAGASMAEFRLRCGFIHLPVGWIAFEGQPELRQLATSPAMAPWDTGTKYERPIARRLIEEAGIPRGAFATVKRATSMSFYFASYWWSKEAVEELRRLERRLLPSVWRRLAYRVDGLFRTACITAYFMAKRASKKVGLDGKLDHWRDTLFPYFWGWAYTHPRYCLMGFYWGQERVAARYPRAGDVDPSRQRPRAEIAQSPGGSAQRPHAAGAAVAMAAGFPNETRTA